MNNVFWATILYLVIVAALFIYGKNSEQKRHFDEMQLLYRLNSYKVAYYTTLSMLGFWMLMEIVDKASLPTILTSTKILITITVGVLASDIYNIVHGSFFYIGEDSKKYLLLSLLLGIINLISGISCLAKNPIVEGGYLILGGGINNFILACFFIPHAIAIAVKMHTFASETN